MRAIVSHVVVAAGLLAAASVPAQAQWLNQPTPGLPRTRDGKPNLTAPAPRTADGRPDLSGLWNRLSPKYARNIAADLAPGDLTPQTQALLQKNLEELGKGFMNVTCVPLGPHYIVAADTTGAEQMKIVQTPSLIVILNPDLTHRQIFMDGRTLEADPNPSWMGYSVGHWDGDTLVVESNGYNDRTWLDHEGHQHTDALRITERYRRRDFGHMDIDVTLSDPKAYTRTWAVSVRAELAPDTEMIEFVCGEKNADSLSHWVGKASDEKRDAVTVPAGVLAKYAGTYVEQPKYWRLEPRIVEITVSNDTLYGNVDGRGRTALVAKSPTLFTGLSGLGVQFVPNANGVPDTLFVKHVSGDYKFARKQVSAAQAPVTWTAQQDHQNMKDQLGIRALRPGPSGNAPAGAPNAANYDPAKANPYPDLPDPLKLKDGRRVTTPTLWWDARRPEIVEDFEREVYGRVPKNVPEVSWKVTQSIKTTIGGIPVAARRVAGHVDNSSYPAISVDIDMVIVTPADVKGRIPVLMSFGNGAMPPNIPANSPPSDAPPGPITSAQLLVAAGWGYVSINTSSIQADNGAGLTKGIIGLVNKGQPRTPDDWGSLRAWAWGASRGLDYLLADPAVDAQHVGIEGVSRYGKAALVAAAFDTRFAMVLVGSSGEGGAKLHRRNFGEAVENLTGAGEYHWMAGNFLKYGTADSTFGSRTPGDLPVDAHELLALVAPRWVFVSYGIPEKGDAHWLDHQGSYMAVVAAGPVFRLLGVRDVGDTRDYHVATMPGVNVGLLDGELAWRQHDGGHEDRSNIPHFIGWADRLMKR